MLLVSLVDDEADTDNETAQGDHDDDQQELEVVSFPGDGARIGKQQAILTGTHPWLAVLSLAGFASPRLLYSHRTNDALLAFLTELCAWAVIRIAVLIERTVALTRTAGLRVAVRVAALLP